MTVPTAPARRRVLLVVAGALAVLGLVLGGAGLLGVDPARPGGRRGRGPTSHDPAHRRRGTPPAAGHRVSPGVDHHPRDRRLVAGGLGRAEAGRHPRGAGAGPGVRPRRLVPRLPDARTGRPVGGPRARRLGRERPVGVLRPRAAASRRPDHGHLGGPVGRAPSRSTPCAPTRRTSSRASRSTATPRAPSCASSPAAATSTTPRARTATTRSSSPGSSREPRSA